MRQILFIIICMFCGTLFAQKLSVESMTLSGNDLSASKYERKDLNGTACALVKVLLPSPDVKFEGNVIEPTDYKTGEYWVYLSSGSKELRIKHPQTQPLHVTFSDYGIKRVESKATYYLSVLMPSTTQSQTQVQAHNQATHDTSSNDIPATETVTVNGVSFKMIRVDGGTFISKQGSDSEDGEKSSRQVMLTTYSIGETEVTQALWQAVMGSNPSTFKGGNLPVENISWDDCQEFIQKLNLLTGKQFRLPSEAEWEYAARGGNKSKGYEYSGSNDVEKVAWNRDNSKQKTHKVKTKKPNELGIYDMSGNVWEWCQDWYGKFNHSSQLNAIDSSNAIRVQCGGSWRNGAQNCNLPISIGASPSSKDSNLGLRLAL